MSDTRQLWPLDGGLHLDSHKSISSHNELSSLKPSARYIIPLQQHIGEEAEPAVSVGDSVLKGQMIGLPGKLISAAAHSPVSGKVIDIGFYNAPHPSSLKTLCIVIENDYEDKWVDKEIVGDFYEVMSSHDLRQLIRNAGIVGLGGAGFPAAIKQTEIDIKTLILNAAECEPYITCDDVLIQHYAKEILAGADIIAHIIKAQECIIAIEDNKPEAIHALQKAADEDGTGFFQVRVIPTLYPSGGEKQIIQVITGQEVPINGLPADIDVLCQNVATAYAIHNAIYKDEPLISRIVTLTGAGMHNPQNMEVLIGSSMQECIEQSGGYKDNAQQLIIGGPMMGFAIETDTLPVTKTTNCLLVTSTDDEHASQPSDNSQMPCIRCGHCVDVCPARLLPQQLYWYASAQHYDRLAQHRLFDCIECGCCSYVCPSHIPLVQYYRFAKSTIRQNKIDTEKSDSARQRFENRQLRLENIKKEREKRLQEKRELLKNKSSDNSKKNAIAEALARVAEKKAHTENKPEPKKINH